ncbi:hypothetical protein dqs_0369 [Azoarcus olearius]|uniref:thymidylate synthase n=1 Tax=Azoarcus sp. (strain BH72) TaxID=418699 RepID=UPI0008064435|nr:thymidylate synthase [Azoarcus olearius]ANQ83446.1 hypothetical protein dqs_0369 [Azoarcus olearius]
MYIARSTLDDLLNDVLNELLKAHPSITATRGEFSELIGCCLHLTNPRARLSRSEGKGKIFSALGEFLWYMSGDTKLDFIDYYVPNRFQEESEDQVRVRSGYGDRLFSFRGLNQVANVQALLKAHPGSRRGVIQLFDAADLAEHYPSIPCTCTLQFLVRDGRLHLVVSMRSNDAYIGLPHDVFAFTLLQEILARSLELELGEYKHIAGSLHLYDTNRPAAQRYLSEGWHSTIAMPEMPEGDPWPAIGELQAIESSLRGGDAIDFDQCHLDPYWQDLAYLLVVLRAGRESDSASIAEVMKRINSGVYKMFVQAKLDSVVAVPAGA